MNRFYRLLGCCLIPCLFSCTEKDSNVDSWHNSERVIRYTPEGENIVITNGDMRFNRALYGTNTAFRIESGDLPEFAFYMPGMGGNLRFAIRRGGKLKWLSDARNIKASFKIEEMEYTISDDILGDSELILSAVPMSDEEGLIVKINQHQLPSDLEIIAIYGGASGKKFSRSGDLNADPADCFFLKPENCRENHYLLDREAKTFALVYGDKFNLTESEVDTVLRVLDAGERRPSIKDKKYLAMMGAFPFESNIYLCDASKETLGLKDLLVSDSLSSYSIFVSATPYVSEESYYMAIYNPEKRIGLTRKKVATLYEEAQKSRKELKSHLVLSTPDSFINPLGGIICDVGNAIYEYPSYMHGAISWRMRLNGWRGAYVADELGWNERARSTFSSYAESQLVQPTSGVVVMDTALNQTRSQEKLGNAMFSSGYICRNPGGDFRPHHYDMNLVFIDQMLNHFQWTGDLKYMQEMWPTLERHLTWEKRVFDADNDGLYDAYACIWASDGLMYNGGGVTHSSAYNYKANKLAAEIAKKIGRDSRPYEREAEKILNAINSRLWMSDKGWWAEYQDGLGEKRVHAAAGLWTIYHAIDSDIEDDFQSYQALRYIDTEIPHIPLNIKDMENQDYYVLSTTNWMPYSWSINNVAFAELLHTALAYWQGGRSEDAFLLWKSAILDAMYCGKSPGNIGQISFYDAARGETYRDFADPTGMLSRTVVEGLYGVKPNMLNNRLEITPGFPKAWNKAAMKVPYLKYEFDRKDSLDIYTLEPLMGETPDILLRIPCLYSSIKNVTINNAPVQYTLEKGVGQPYVVVNIPSCKKAEISICWQGKILDLKPKEIIAATNELNVIEFDGVVKEIKDPQQVVTEQEISDGHVQLRLDGTSGERTLFALVENDLQSWWQPIHVHLNKAVEIIPADNEDGESINFYVRNNSERELKGMLYINPAEQALEQTLIVASKSISPKISIAQKYLKKGTNVVRVIFSGKTYEACICNWEIPLQKAAWDLVDITDFFNEKIDCIFKNCYLSPRSPYVTLQLPTQGIGEWCHPKMTAEVNDLAMRASGGIFSTPFGLSFKTVQEKTEPNVIFVSKWDNYLDSCSLPLSGNAKHAYLLMAGTTNHMQSQFDNGEIKIIYKDGSCDSLILRNPESWAPIERDYYTDGYAFKMKGTRPYRVMLKSGLVARNFENVINGTKLDERYLVGGAAIILDLPLDSSKELDELKMKAIANDVVIGLMAVTLER